MLTLRAGQLEAEVVPEAGMVVASLRHRGEELLGLRNGLDAYVETGSTFGIPLLYPFANRLAADRFEVDGRPVDVSAARRDEHGLPIHGLPRARGPWTVEHDTPESVRASLDWPADDPGFPFAHRVTVTHELAPTALTVVTQVEGDAPVAFGWHPYLAAAPGDAIELPSRRRIALDDRGLPTWDARDEPASRGEQRGLDDLYTEVGGPFVLHRAGRRVTVTFHEGADYAQVFAPAGEPVVAFEPMAAPTNALFSGDGLGRAPWALRFSVEVATA